MALTSPVVLDEGAVARGSPPADARATVQTLAPGFLIAMPRLGDPNFQRAVILVIEHGSGGAMGLVINRAAPLTLADVAEGHDLKLADGRGEQQVFLGGPVEPQRGFVLHDSSDVPEKHEIVPGLYLSVTLDALAPLLGDTQCKLRFCLGYAGWGPKQLDHEIAAGAWLFTEAERVAVLEGEADSLWDSTLRGMGVDPAMIVSGAGVQ